MIKTILKWLFSVLFGCSTMYYIYCRIFKIENYFVTLVNTAISVIGFILNFLESHLLAILIVIGVAIALWLLYNFIVSKIKLER